MKNVCAKYDGSERSKLMIHLLSQIMPNKIKFTGHTSLYYGIRNEYPEYMKTTRNCEVISIEEMIQYLQQLLESKKDGRASVEQTKNS